MQSLRIALSEGRRVKIGTIAMLVPVAALGVLSISVRTSFFGSGDSPSSGVMCDQGQTSPVENVAKTAENRAEDESFYTKEEIENAEPIPWPPEGEGEERAKAVSDDCPQPEHGEPVQIAGSRPQGSP
jgi:hypothetical protein